MESVVIIPAYNNKHELKKCLEALNNQSYKDFYVIVVDDGSSPRLESEIEVSYDIDVKFYWKENEGAGKARNYALTKVSKNIKYVFFVDSDDSVEESYLKTMTEMMNSNGLEFCQASYMVNGKLKVRYPYPESYEIIDSKEGINGFILELFGSCPDHGDVQKYNTALWACAFRMDIIRSNGLKICSERQYMSEDTLFKIDYLKECRKIGLFTYAGYLYKESNSSLTHKVYDNQLEVLKNFYTALETRIMSVTSEKKSIQRLYRKMIMYYTNTILTYSVSKDANKLNKIREVLKDDIFMKSIHSIKISKLNTKNIIFIMLARLKAAYILMKAGEMFGK
ncbi:glycosyltransferase family A protein [Eubacterium sp.]